MNSIEDERIKFYLEHEAVIQEWASLEAEVREFVDRFYRSLKDDLDAALASGKIADDGVESFLHEIGGWPGLGLRRRDWPKGDDDPDVRLEWNRNSAFPAGRAPSLRSQDERETVQAVLYRGEEARAHRWFLPERLSPALRISSIFAAASRCSAGMTWA